MNKLNLNNEQTHFSAVNYPEVLNEIKEITRQVNAVSGNFKREILISFLRYHSLKIEWLAGNDLLVKMIAAGSMKINRTERLFESNHDNTAFLDDLEAYIETELANCQFDPKHNSVFTAIRYVSSLQNKRHYPSARAMDFKHPLCLAVESHL